MAFFVGHDWSDHNIEKDKGKDYDKGRAKAFHYPRHLSRRLFIPQPNITDA